MQVSIDAFYEEVISPCVRDFEQSRSSLRYAYGAVWALDSFASHVFYFYKDKRSLHQSGDIVFKNECLAKKSPDFKFVMDVSAATKHAVRSQKDPSKISVYRGSDLSSAKLEGWSAYFAGPDADEWGDQVIVHNDKNLFSPLLPKVLRAEIFLKEVWGDLSKDS